MEIPGGWGSVKAVTGFYIGVMGGGGGGLWENSLSPASISFLEVNKLVSCVIG